MTTIRDDSAPHGRHPALEEVAAFVDGRLEGEERRRMVAHLADCGACQELVTETVLLLREAPAEAAAEDAEPSGDEGDDAPAATGRLLAPPPSRFRRTLPLIAALAAAAVVALLVWTPAGERILGRGSRPVSVAELSAPLPVTEPLLPEALHELLDRHGWRQFRGAEEPLTAAPETSFQVGLLLAQLEAALRSGDTATAETLTYRLETRTDSPPLVALGSYFAGPGSVREGLEGGQPTLALAALTAEADHYLAPSGRDEGPVESHYYALGKWAGAGQLAVATGQLDWFEEPGPRRALRQLRRADLPPGLAEPFSTITDVLDAGPTAADLPRLAAAFETLIRRAGGGRDPEEAS